MCRAEQPDLSTGCKSLIQRKIACQVAAGPTLAHVTVATPQEDPMLWLVTIGMAVVGGFWVKTRRARKAKDNTYVPQ